MSDNFEILVRGRVDAARSGDEQAFRALVQPLDRELHAYAYAYAVCLTVISLDADGRVVELTTFVLPELFAAWGFPPVLDT